MPELPGRHPVPAPTEDEGELIRRLRSTLGRLEAALASISDALAISDAEGRLLWCNQAFETLATRHRLLLVGQSIFTLLPADAEGRPLLERMRIRPDSLEGGRQQAVLREDPLLAVSIEWRPVLSEPERPLVFCIRDISADLASAAMRREVDRIAAERQIFEAQAMACPVTGLPNRRALEERLALAFAGLSQQPGQLTLLFCDLDGFKQVNDAYGHASGDALLQIVGERLKGCLRANDLVARLGGDEFVVLSHGPRCREEALDLGLRLLEGVCRPWIHGGRTLKPAMSVGVAITRDATLGGAELLRRADLAMYEAKGSEELPLVLHDTGIEWRSHASNLRAHRLQEALAQGSGLALGTRPILELQPPWAQGLELWPRLQDSDGQSEGGADLLHLADRHGLCGPLGRWLRTAAIAQLRQAAGPAVTLVAFRIGRGEVVEPGLSQELEVLVRSQGVDPARIALLLADELLRDPPPALCGELQALRRLGVQLVVDDFGMGTTPLQALMLFPLTAVRLHPGLGAGEERPGLLPAAIRLVRDLDLDVIASPIASEAQLQDLRQLGCRWGQGPHVDAQVTGADRLSGNPAGSAPAP
ncbi:MAG: diguanylate cyclase domain-containing protein [Cyanobium sp.]